MTNIYDMTDTWNDAATTYTSVKMNVTNSASAAGSNLLDLQVGGSSKAVIDKDGNMDLSGELRVSQIDPNPDGTGGTLIINGDLQVDGTTTTINSNNLTVDDLNITVASGAGSATAANGAGLTVDGANATWNYASTGDKWVSNKDIDVGTNQIFYSNVFANLVDLPAASSYHGMFAHVHSEQAAYYAHAGSWVKLADHTATPSYESVGVDNLNIDGNTISSTTGNLILDPVVGANIQLDGLTWPAADGTSGQVLSTNGSGSLSWAPNYSDTDVNTHLNTSSAQTNEVLSWNGSDYVWVANSGGGGLADVVDDTTPQLGGSLDVNGNSIVSTTNGNITITPDGTGSIVLDGLNWPQADGGTNQFLKTNGSGQLSWGTASGGSGITAVADDAAPALGGNLNVAGYTITSASGGNIAITPDTTGNLVLDGLNWPQADGTTDYVLKTNGSGQLSWVAQTTAAALGYTQAASQGTVTNTAGSDATIPAASTSYAGLMTAQDKTDLGSKISAANLGYTQAAAQGTVTNSAGTDVVLPAANTTYAGLMTAQDKTDLGNAPNIANATNRGHVEAINQGLATTDNVRFNNLDVDGILHLNHATPASGTSTITGPATMVLDPAAVGDDTGLVRIAGSLQVDGTTTTINSTTMTVDDLNIVVASGAANAGAADGAGITVDGASATLQYASTPDEWQFNKQLGIKGDGATVNGELGLQSSSGTYTVTIEGPDETGGSSYTLHLPQTGPTAGQFLAQNSGNTQLEFVDPPSSAGIAAAMALVLG